MVGILKKVFLINKSETENNIDINDLSEGNISKAYKIKEIKSNNEEIERFLFSLGCYKNEIVTLISNLGETYVVKIKEGRYCIDKQLATAIKVEAI